MNANFRNYWNRCAPEKFLRRVTRTFEAPAVRDLGLRKWITTGAAAGLREVIFGKGKTPEQVAEIVRSMVRHQDGRQNILITRAK